MSAKIKALPRGALLSLGISGVLLSLFWLLRGNVSLMSGFARVVTSPLKRAVGAACALVPFSMAEVIWAALILFCVWYVARAVWRIVRGKGERVRLALYAALGSAVIALCVYTGYTLLWGVNYYTQSFEQQAQITVHPVTHEELIRVTRLFADRVNETADATMPSTETLLAESGELYDGVSEVYPFLREPRVRAKPMVFSELLSAMNYTGFFFPFTGEANININAPMCFLPVTIAHELAHLRGIAPEQTANFVAILACEHSGKPEYEYSGWLFGYLHLSNALYTADPAAYTEIAATLHPRAIADFRENNAYWQQRETPVAAAADAMYDGFLQSYQQELGARSYGAVTDLLVAYYGGQA